MTENLVGLLLRLSEAGEPALVWGRQLASYRGRDLEQLLDRGILVEQAPASEWDVCSDCECGYECRPIQQVNGRSIAACPLNSGNDEVLAPEDPRVYQIGRSRLVRLIAEASGFEDEPSTVAPGVWRIGLTAPGRAVYVALDQSAIMQLGLTQVLRTADPGAALTLVGPALAVEEQIRLREAGIDVVELRAALVDDGDRGLSFDWTALEPASLAPRVVVRGAAAAIMIDGLEISLPHQPLRLFRALAEKVRSGRAFMSPREIEQLTGREPRDIVRELRRHLRAAGVATDERGKLIETKRGHGWGLALRPAQIHIES